MVRFVQASLDLFRELECMLRIDRRKRCVLICDLQCA